MRHRDSDYGAQADDGIAHKLGEARIAMQLTKEGAEPRGCGSCLSKQGLGGSWWTFNINVLFRDESQHEALFERFLAYHSSVELIAKPEHATWRACSTIEEASAKADGAAEGHLCAAKTKHARHHTTSEVGRRKK